MFEIFLVVGVLFVLAVVMLVAARMPDSRFEYTKGCHGFSPLGEFVASGRQKKDGQWVRLFEMANRHEEVKDGRDTVYRFEYPHEADWMAAAARKASEFLSDGRFQDVKVYYHDEDVMADAVRKETVWANGEWF